MTLYSFKGSFYNCFTEQIFWKSWNSKESSCDGVYFQWSCRLRLTKKGIYRSLSWASFKKKFQSSFFLKYLRENRSVLFRSLWHFISNFIAEVTVFLRAHFDSCPCTAQLQQELFNFLSKYRLFTYIRSELFFEMSVPQKGRSIIHQTTLPRLT